MYFVVTHAFNLQLFKHIRVFFTIAADMDIIEIVEKRKLLREAKRKMKPVWSIATKRGVKKRNEQIAVRDLLKDIAKLLNVDHEYRFDSNSALRIRQLVNRGLLLDPTLHTFYVIKGTVAMHEGKWSEAIRSYESAKLFMKNDKKLPGTPIELDDELLKSYWRRLCHNYDNGLMMEAASDCEHILMIRPRTIVAQDKLLDILLAMDKYHAFRRHWCKFMPEATDHERTATLLARHAEFKIRRREIVEARLILFDALDRDPRSQLAQELLQMIYNMGHTMAAYTVIWCMHGCYDKALLTIEKGRDCDPHNPGYTLLRTIVLRLSGRLIEAADWLENVNQGFYKLLEPSRDVAHGSIMGKLSIDETRQQLIKQWYLIRYDIALKYAVERKFLEACQIILDCQLQKVYPQARVLLKDISTLQRRAYP